MPEYIIIQIHNNDGKFQLHWRNFVLCDVRNHNYGSKYEKEGNEEEAHVIIWIWNEKCALMEKNGSGAWMVAIFVQRNRKKRGKMAQIGYKNGTARQMRATFFSFSFILSLLVTQLPPFAFLLSIEERTSSMEAASLMMSSEFSGEGRDLRGYFMMGKQ